MISVEEQLQRLIKDKGWFIAFSMDGYMCFYKNGIAKKECKSHKEEMEYANKILEDIEITDWDGHSMQFKYKYTRNDFEFVKEL